MLFSGLAALVAPALASPAAQVTLLHTNDLHGRLLPFTAAPGSATSQTGDPGRSPLTFARSGRIGGVAWLAGAIDGLRDERGEHATLVLDAGDTFSDSYLGNATEGAAMIEAMNHIGYDMMALGNHDFDYGFERTQALAEMADFPIRAANVRRDGEPVLGRPWQLFTLAGARVAVLALGYHNTGETGNPNHVEGLTFADGIAAVRKHLPAMRAAADVVVVLSHQGTAVDRQLARSVDGVDLVIGGHSHDRLAPAERIGDTWVTQALADGAVLGVTTLTLDDEHRVVDVDARATELWHDRIEPDDAVTRLIEEHSAPHREAMERVIAHAADRIDRQYKSPSAFDQLVGAVLRERTGADVAFMPGVGYGVSLSPGPVTRNALYTLLPHPAPLVTMKLTGAQIESVLEQTATNLAPGAPAERVGGLVQTSGLGYTADLRAPAGARVRDIVVAGRALVADRVYTVATNAGIARGLHRYTAFTEGRDRRVHEVSVTEAVAQAFRERGTLVAPPMNDIRIIRAPTAAGGEDDRAPG